MSDVAGESLVMAQRLLDQGFADRAQAYALVGILDRLTAISSVYTVRNDDSGLQGIDLEGKVIVDSDFFAMLWRLGLAARDFFTNPNDTAFNECSKALDEWDRKAVDNVSDV